MSEMTDTTTMTPATATPVRISRAADEGAEVDLELLESTLDYIRPAIQMDGGDIRLEHVQGGVVTVQFYGACDGCPISPVTLKQGVERILKERVPSVTQVVAIEA